MVARRVAAVVRAPLQKLAGHRNASGIASWKVESSLLLRRLGRPQLTPTMNLATASAPKPSSSWDSRFVRRLVEELAKVRQEITTLDERRRQEVGSLDVKWAERDADLARYPTCGSLWISEMRARVREKFAPNATARLKGESSKRQVGPPSADGERAPTCNLNNGSCCQFDTPEPPLWVGVYELRELRPTEAASSPLVPGVSRKIHSAAAAEWMRCYRALTGRRASDRDRRVNAEP